MTMWAAGMHCVFIKPYEWVATGSDLVFPIKGRVYTVREVVVGGITGEICLRLHGISNAHVVGQVRPYAGLGAVRITGEPAFEADRFRPLSSRRLDVFQADLAPREMEAAR